MTFQELSTKVVEDWAKEHHILVSQSPLSVWYASSPTSVGHSDLREIVIGYGRNGTLSAGEAVPHLLKAVERLMDKAVGWALRLDIREDPRRHWRDALVKVVHIRSSVPPGSESDPSHQYFDHHWTVSLLVIPR